MLRHKKGCTGSAHDLILTKEGLQCAKCLAMEGGSAPKGTMKVRTHGIIKVQCKDEEGTTATFIECNGRRVSPPFDSLADLYPWMRANGWAELESWKVVKEETVEGR